MWSFDVFDTCLVRRHAVPTDVFLDVAYRLENQLLPVLGTDYAVVFREARVNAEALALKRNAQEETTLEAIWQELKGLIPEIDVTIGMSMEIEVESETLVAVPETFLLVKSARAQFSRVVFITDSYLPSGFIEAQLRKFNFFIDGDYCFVSSEYCKTKRTGTLFNTVISALSISPGALTHHGDNLHSDIRAARAAGINAIHLRYATLSPMEREIGTRLLQIDAVKSSALIGAMRVARIEKQREESAAARSLVGDFIGPFLWVMADWILSRAKRDGVRKLYFFSRDCYALHRIATVLAEKQNLEIDCRYLRVSRQALLLPAVTMISPEGIPWLRRSWEKGRLLDIAGKLEIDVKLLVEMMPSIIGDAGGDFCLENDGHWESLWNVLNKDPLKNELLARIAQRRKTTLAYLKQEGLFENIPIGVVDLGWHQSCQSALTDLVRRLNPSTTLSGYFLALVDERFNYMSCLPAQAIFHRAPRDRRVSFGDPIVFSRITLLEHVLNCAPQGTVHHYEHDELTKEMKAVCLDVNEKELKVKQTLFENIVKFAENHIHPLHITEHEARDILNCLLTYVTQNPNGTWPQFLSSIRVARDQNDNDSEPMTKSRNWINLLLDFVFLDLSAIKMGVWPELSWAACNPKIRLGYRCLNKTIKVLRIFRRLFDVRKCSIKLFHSK